jgi:cold shock CspA family protein
MAKVMVFMDGSWLYSGMRSLGDDFQVDYGKLPVVLGEVISKKLGVIPVDIVRTFLFGSNATNYQDEDVEMVKRRRTFYDILREEYDYDVQVYAIDYRGRRLRKADRHPEDEFNPEEKCVDIALASSMLYFAALPYVYDIAVLVGGDRDFVPVLQKVRQLGKRVAIASIHGSCAFELLDSKNLKGVRDFDVIWLDELLDDISASTDEKLVECNSPLHTGPNPLHTDEFVRRHRPFYCKECRKKMREERSRFQHETVAGGEPSPKKETPDESLADNFGNLHMRAGASYMGRIKRLMEYCGFIETEEGDFYFGMDDCAAGTDFYKLEEGAKVEFTVTNMPPKQFHGSKGKGNGSAEGVSLLTDFNS